jgi:hypothetical protein
MQRITLTTTIVKKPHVTQIRVDHEMVIMEETSQSYFGLNAIGAQMWSLLDIGPISMMEIAQYLHKKYHLDERQSIHDAQEFVELLLSNNLIYLSDV